MTARRRAGLLGVAPVLAVLATVSACSAGSPSSAASGSAVSASAAATAAAPASSGAADSLTDPVTVFELADPIVHYQAQVVAGVARLDEQVRALAHDVDAGDLPAARSDWLTAHLTYHRLGAAYGAFGDLGTAIDRLAHGLPGGVADPDFTGFHRVELALWSSGPGGGTAGAAAPTARLVRDVAALRARVGALEIPANTFTLRAHEILEDTLQFQLTGQDDYGSGSGLATAQADLEGTRSVVALLRPVIDRRRPALGAQIDAALAGVASALTAALTSAATSAPTSAAGEGGGGQAIGTLPAPLRRRVDAAVGQALETLAPVPGLLAVEEDDD